MLKYVFFVSLGLNVIMTDWLFLRTKISLDEADFVKYLRDQIKYSRKLSLRRSREIIRATLPFFHATTAPTHPQTEKKK